ncbi:MAG TPA: SusC/RagA family protein, partial [Porphyromonadaceae bacterium]|nr:SusC/RagA family protein [Porphyromonadaceae bacterium]
MNYFCLLRRNKNHSPCNYLLKTFGFMKISLFLLFFYTLPVLAENTHSQIVQQKVSVAGTVVDADGVPLTGVTVRVKGTTQGTITNIDGAYSLDLSDGNATLIFSYIGFESQEIQVAGKQTIDITLNEDINIMDEVVVIGYGTMQKRQVTSAIASLSADDLPVGVGGTDIAASLQGKIAGLVMAGNDSPNAESTFQLRGMGSINASKSPLIVIDGMPGGDIRNISPEEIESIDVLKDASAGAIYGSRATSGVILITTKQAKAGRIQLSYTGEAMFRQAFGKPHMLNAAEYLATGGKGDFGGDTDWYDEALSDQPLSQRHTITLQGGSENARIYASVAYNDNHGVLKYDNRKDYSGRMNTDFKLFDGWLDISTHLTYRQAARDRRFDRGDMEGVLLTNPTQPMLDPNSATGWNVWTGGGEGASVNKIAEAALQTREGLDKWFRPDVSLRLNILPVEGLTYRQTAAYENRQWENHEYDPSTQREEILAGRKGTAR